MPVIINEFEVITAPPSAKQGADQKPAAANSAGAPGPTAHDIEQVVRHQKERCARVRAH
ncbi:MAG: hypothetical protein J2P37_15060 [Ktedonobacteraceae bacterium]|nr:hypothetical protein [Ktedonobacteraceae bacterium]MBO0790160.1 hypothetical protein [Ktedonobacteraceae bacterium]